MAQVQNCCGASQPCPTQKGEAGGGVWALGGGGGEALHAPGKTRHLWGTELPLTGHTSLGPGLLGPPEVACVGVRQARTCVLCLQEWLLLPDPRILGDLAVGTAGHGPQLLSRTVWGPC